MDEHIDELLIDVRASTRGFAEDIAQMRGSVDSVLGEGFGRAGNILERGLLSALRKGSLGFEDLKRTATQVLDQIAAQALQLGLDQIFGGSQGSGGLGDIFGGLVGSLFGLPGRATGGPVSPGRGYLVGERGPELFVPTSAGRVETMQPARAVGRDVRIAIQLSQPRGTSAPVALQRSSRQVASAVRRALLSI
ncbi:tail tape measure protein [Pontixanthobacter aquaemixtae]|uniref:Tail tape measure protein n=1 Tax=Pontixanthobacter aquaemixtae TaxID=1958940 RepID=A0A844ZWT9_9SPHN|nr:tail tape measure protein [Pontixanthobacter aquaemixtae]MXO91227.1 tail tape measure protein [Pontixanthobacter aquaemixtae]